MPFQFPDPSVSTTATLPNGEKWEYVDGSWRAVPTQDDDQQQIDEIKAINIRQDEEIDEIQDLDLTDALSALAIARQDIIELQSKVNTLELTNFLILE